ncbi:aminopeptidase [Membranihabitans marinus]|uniref:aminopeptidase n=1 Tax=Membranihabitans marinus TaxID=1227546 RepID=UPI001F3BAD5D|nr:aminopeptidase [Membranihabitans marinus]
MTLLEKYAALLVDYCLEIKTNDRLFVKTTFLAEPLVRHIYEAVIARGGHMEVDFVMKGQNQIYFDHAQDHQLNYISPTTLYRYQHFEKYLFIRAPHNLFEDKSIDSKKLEIRSKASAELNNLYFERTASGSMDRSLCQYPTDAAAQAAEMSLEDYKKFVYNACLLYQENPIDAWLEVRKKQQAATDILNNASIVQYKGSNIDISFSCQGRTWINSDGRSNMPSGEIFTAPVDDSVQGEVYFSYPAIYRGHEVEGVRLVFKDGLVTEWSAEKGGEFLDAIMKVPGARRLGEAAIGTNYNIQQITKNILFDEKIGGSIHLALGQAYKQCGGKNTSSVHWDMITDMKEDGEIYIDGQLIYKSGKFVF